MMMLKTLIKKTVAPPSHLQLLKIRSSLGQMSRLMSTTDKPEVAPEQPAAATEEVKPAVEPEAPKAVEAEQPKPRHDHKQRGDKKKEGFKFGSRDKEQRNQPQQQNSNVQPTRSTSLFARKGLSDQDSEAGHTYEEAESGRDVQIEAVLHRFKKIQGSWTPKDAERFVDELSGF
jgi:outer membrane biosynthesis protein TonB